AEHEVACQRGIDGNVRGLQVANLANHDDIRILPDEGSETAGESDANPRIYVDLIDAGQVVLDRIFDGVDIKRRIVDSVEGSIKCSRFAAAGGSRYEYNSMRTANELLEELLLVRVKPELLQRSERTGLFE